MSDEQPFVSLEPDVVLAIQLTAGRVSFDPIEFAAKLQNLMESCRRQGYAAAKAAEIRYTQIQSTRGDNQLFESHAERAAREGIDLPQREAPPLLSEERVPGLTPMRTRDDAMEVYRRNHPEAESKEVPKVQAPAHQAPRPQLHIVKEEKEPELIRELRGRRNPLTDLEKADIRRRYKAAKVGRVRIEKGWIKHISKEYHVNDSYIYNIIYSDPELEAI